MFSQLIFPNFDPNMNQNFHRFLSHNRGANAPLDGEDDSLRALTDDNGYCIEYRETKEDHMMRIANRLRNNEGINALTVVGMTKGL